MSISESYRYCERIARTRAKNFYYSFVLLSAAQRKAMCAIYAYMRYCDDLSDDESNTDRAGSIAKWRADLEQALSEGPLPQHPLWPAFRDTVDRFKIPHEYFFEMIKGVSSDLEPRRLQTFAELYDYCYKVASVVGLTIIHIFGFESPEALALAEKCGIAFQLTNIIRDIKEDAALDRIYLPAEDLLQFGVVEEDLSAPQPRVALTELLRFEATRAREYYNESRPLLGLIHKKSRSSLWALIEIYSRLLDRIEAANYDVLTQRVRLTTAEKAGIVMQGFLR
ncbi:MAG TPA: phytoene/squalene synthase family protein [Bryobacteraceae bacterium]|jgi:phytoene synthase